MCLQYEENTAFSCEEFLLLWVHISVLVPLGVLVSVQEVLLLCVVEKGDQHEVVQRRFAPLMYSLLA